MCGRRVGEDEESFPEVGKVLDLAGVAVSKNAELLRELEEDRINQILQEALLSAPATNAASLRAGDLKAALNQQPSPCHPWVREASMREPSSPNPRRETARMT